MHIINVNFNKGQALLKTNIHLATSLQKIKAFTKRHRKPREMLLNGRYVKGYSHPQTKLCQPHRMIQGIAPGGKTLRFIRSENIS